ncbi:hypothetical protein A2348_04255 [Candidatus Uhrbacteria bacterium RIFOXYB12_FULL_58_10]|uniref:Peptidase M50 domain-containing protein n=1 Tax=Candidatus Uhrbacteria bacterium RIFOXYB2_FULL_57_15 TaxID=1802422 RepID=A0A1F7WAP7_9BACT|nr:MAG: hypothetical protein A2348_04255 [Candidatus Uhrbacteria bacterium RIFOXYB12_FULL_58_10]OGL99458.1 MAG: hypothetical protein A2304_02455 [Candidatus Uhrbacteria bacterium RIFOXYB2_FULL_57_15]OGL99898.1 MAG: hypothetical protein A2501_05205 [Candidatus Uhrbacteria bacterium RIFOXYC12_FULL_57_11]
MSNAELRLAGFPITVRPSVLLLIAAIGWTVVSSGQSLWLLACYVSTLFASVLLHELGHAFALRFVGVRGQTVTLHGLGGQVEWDGSVEPLTNVEHLFVSLAGPVSGLMVGMLALAAIPFASDAFVLNVLGQAVLLNVCMNVGNMMPALPLDGGQALLSCINAVTPRGWKLGAYLVVYLGSVVGSMLLFAAYFWGNVFLLLIGGQILLFNASQTEWLFSDEP